jgi:hypothetical protein
MGHSLNQIYYGFALGAWVGCIELYFAKAFSKYFKMLIQKNPFKLQEIKNRTFFMIKFCITLASVNFGMYFLVNVGYEDNECPNTVQAQESKICGNIMKITFVPMVFMVMHYSHLEYEENPNFYADLGYKNLPVYFLVNLIGFLPIAFGFITKMKVDVFCILAVLAACASSAVWFVRIRPV